MQKDTSIVEFPQYIRFSSMYKYIFWETFWGPFSINNKILSNAAETFARSLEIDTHSDLLFRRSCYFAKFATF